MTSIYFRAQLNPGHLFSLGTMTQGSSYAYHFDYLMTANRTQSFPQESLYVSLQHAAISKHSLTKITSNHGSYFNSWYNEAATEEP